MTLLSLRERAADGFDRMAVGLWEVAHRLRPVDTRPRCPDCQLGPDVGDDCPVCREQIEEKAKEEMIWESGYLDGLRMGRGEDE